MRYLMLIVFATLTAGCNAHFFKRDNSGDVIYSSYHHPVDRAPALVVPLGKESE